MVVICDFHSQGRGSIPRGGAFKAKDSKNKLFLTYNLNGRVRIPRWRTPVLADRIKNILPENKKYVLVALWISDCLLSSRLWVRAPPRIFFLKVHTANLIIYWPNGKASEFYSEVLGSIPG